MRTTILAFAIALSALAPPMRCDGAEPAKADPAFERKLTTTIVPMCSFSGCDLEMICGSFSQRAKELSADKLPLKIHFESEKVAIKQPGRLSLSDAPLGVAFAYAVEMAGAGMIIEGDTIRITGNSTPGGMKAADFANKEVGGPPDLSKIVIPFLKLDDDGDFEGHLFAVKMESEKSNRDMKPVNLVSMVDAKVGKKSNGMEFKNKTVREVLEEMAKATETRVVFAAHAVEFRSAEAIPAEAK